MTLDLVRVVGNRDVLVPRGWDVFTFEGRTYRRVRGTAGDRWPSRDVKSESDGR